MSTHAVGVDWSSGAWVAVAYSTSDTDPVVEVRDTIREIWSEYEETARRIVVDVPIGLYESRDSEECPSDEAGEEISRECDDIARDVIGPRSSSVFTAPAREAAVKAVDTTIEYAEVNEKNKNITGKGLMRQAANISNGIVEVEGLLLNDGDSELLVEGHPEVCFRAFNGDYLQHSKKTAPGVVERLEALENVDEYAKGDWRDLGSSLLNEGRRVQLDDLLDALALALTAHASEGELHRLPQDPPRDAKGLPMQMVYRANEPLGR